VVNTYSPVGNFILGEQPAPRKVVEGRTNP